MHGRVRFRHSPDQEQEKPEEEKPKEFTKRIAYEINKRLKALAKASKTYLKLLHFVRPYWYLALIVLILSGLSSFTSILPTQITGVAIDQIWAAGDSAINDNTDSPNQTPRARPKGKTLTIEPIINKTTDYIAKKWMPNKQ